MKPRITKRNIEAWGLWIYSALIYVIIASVSHGKLLQNANWIIMLLATMLGQCLCLANVTYKEYITPINHNRVLRRLFTARFVKNAMKIYYRTAICVSFVFWIYSAVLGMSGITQGIYIVIWWYLLIVALLSTNRNYKIMKSIGFRSR